MLRGWMKKAFAHTLARVNVVFAVIGEQGWGDCYIAPVVWESCRLPVFSYFDYDEMLSHTSQSVYYIHGRYAWI